MAGASWLITTGSDATRWTSAGPIWWTWASWGRTGALVPAMARKWRQINKFVEIVAQAWQHNTLANRVGRAGQPPLRIRDYGAGKGYLTFALYDHLTHALGL